MPELTRYIILFQGRAGSTLLTDHMTTHPQIRAMYEEFSTRPRDWETQQAWLTDFFFPRDCEPEVRAIGFKTKYTDIAELEPFRDFIRQHGIRVIHLSRRNLVKLIVSVLRAEELRERCGESNRYQNLPPLGKIRIDVDKFRQRKARVRIYEELRRYVEALGVDVCHLHYEQFLHDLGGTLQQVWRFLGVDDHPTSAQVLKNTPDRLADAVENLDELRAAFPEFESYFAEE